MAKTKAHHRAFALIMALLFLGTAIASGAAVVWQIRQDNKSTNATSVTADEAQSNQTQDTGGNKLEGTKLANFTPISKVDSLQITDTKEGIGEVVKPGATVTAHYTGAVASTGVIFQSSHDGQNQPIPFSLSGVIKGWTDGVPGMKVGGTRRLLIPAAQAYGDQSQPGIPANSDLVFDIELVSVQNP